MRKITLAGFVLAVVLSLSLTACKDTKTLQENDQLKAQVAQLQQENGQLGNNLESVTASRDALAQENAELKAKAEAKPKIKVKVVKRPAHKAVRKARRRRRKAHAA